MTPGSQQRIAVEAPRHGGVSLRSLTGEPVMNNTCSGCGNPATVEIIDNCFLCDHCEAVLKTEIEKSQAKATKGESGMAGATRPVRHNNRRTGLRVGEASADLPATSEFMDVTAGETATNSFIENAEQSLSDRSPALAPAEMSGSIAKDAGADFSSPLADDTAAGVSASALAQTAPRLAGADEQFPDLPDFLKRERAA